MSVFAKLNLGTHTRIHVRNAPVSFVTTLERLEAVTVCTTLAARDRTA